MTHITIREWAKRKRTKPLWLEAAARLMRWPDLLVKLTETEYDAAISAAQNIRIR